MTVEYIIRAQDEKVFQALQYERSLVTVVGSKRTGKTSLLYRMYSNCSRQKILANPVLIDFRILLISA